MVGEIWDLIILSPMINVLIVLSDYLFNSFGLTIIVLTIITRVVMYPLTMKQLRASKAMQSIQAEVVELRKKYAKDRQKLAQEQMKLYKESGMNPAGCLVPMLVQMPIWIALYQAIIRVLAVAPEDFLNLSRHLYTDWPWPQVFSLVPLDSNFLGMNLAVSNMLLAILAGASMWVSQKMMMSPTPDPKQQAQSQMMLYMMPMMFVFIGMQVPSGLTLYWVVSTVIQIGTQYFLSGWGGLVSSKAVKKIPGEKKEVGPVAQQKGALKESDMSADIVVEPSSAEEEELAYGNSGSKRQDRGGGYPDRLRATRRKPGRGGGHHRKRR